MIKRFGMSNTNAEWAGFALRSLCLALMLATLASGLFRPLGVAADASATGTVYSHFFGCDTNKMAIYQDHGYLKQNCTDTTYYVTWSLVSEGQNYSPIQGASPADVRFDNVPNHIFTMVGNFDIYGGPAFVYCQNGDTTGTADGYELMDVAITNMGNTVHPTMGSAGYVTCDWFGTPVSNPAGAGTISISTWQCPDGFDLAHADPNVLPATCALPINGLELSVESYNNPKQAQTTGQNAGGRVFFQQLNADFVQITGAPDNFGTPRVFCRAVLGNGSSSIQTVEIPAINATFPYNLLAGEELTCDWYAVQAARGQVYVNVHLCPSGPDLTQADLNTLAASCQQTMNGVTFTLTPAGQPGQTAVSGQTATNGVLWQDLPPGKTSIGQMPMSGFASRVFCDQSVPGDSGKVHYTERTIAGSVFSTKIDPGEELACDWFDLNDGGANGTGGMSLFTFACPAGFDAGNASPDDFGSNCADPLNGIGFALAAQNGNLTGNTGDYQAGVVNFYDVPQQGAVVVATPPAGYTTGAVFCGQALAYDGQPDGFDRMATYDTDAIQTEIVPGAQDVCRWFFTASNGALVFDGNQAEPDATATADDNADTGNNNGSGDGQSATDAPSDDNSDPSDAQGATAGTVTVINHVCPSGFDAIDADINTLYQECTGDGNGFLFALTTEGVTTNQTSGDALDQSAVWTGVPAHRFTIEEGIPDGYGAGAAYCTASTGESTYYPGSAIHPDLPANAALTCDWFTAQQ